MMDWITNPEAWVALVTLTILEIVLGVDNIIFISILTRKLPPEQRDFGRKLGLGLALFGRVILLLSISWVMGLKEDFFSISSHGVSGRDLILLVGGLFLLYKATKEIHESVEGGGEHHASAPKASFRSVLIQILILDVVFSLDSVITAVGMAEDVVVMIIAVVIAVGFMMFSAARVADFIHRHPTVKMLALAFLLIVGMSLVVDGVGGHLPRGYIYFAMGFSMFVEMLNLKRQEKLAKREASKA